MTLAPHTSNNWKKLKPVLAIIALGAVAIMFISGTAIFVYQMLRAG